VVVSHSGSTLVARDSWRHPSRLGFQTSTDAESVDSASTNSETNKLVAPTSAGARFTDSEVAASEFVEAEFADVWETSVKGGEGVSPRGEEAQEAGVEVPDELLLKEEGRLTLSLLVLGHWPIKTCMRKKEAGDDRLSPF